MPACTAVATATLAPDVATTLTAAPAPAGADERSAAPRSSVTTALAATAAGANRPPVSDP